MGLNKLTERAKNVLRVLAEHPHKKAKARDVIASIALEKGLGSLILKEFPLQLDQNKEFSVQDVLEQAYLESMEIKHPYVGTEHLLLALCKLANHKDYKALQKKISGFGTYPKPPKRSVSGLRRTPVLDAFGENLNQLFEQKMLGTLVDRHEVQKLCSVLLQKERPNPLLIGEPGVGKSSLVRLLAQKIATFEIPAPLTNLQIVDFDLSGFLNSVIGREGVEAGIGALTDEMLTVGNVVLFVKDIHFLFMPAGSGTLPPFVGALFKSNFLYSGSQIIASTTPTMYQRYISEDDAVSEFFSEIKIAEPSKKEALEILNVKAKELEVFHDLLIPSEVVEYTYSTANKYIKNKKFPQKGVELIDQAAASFLLSKNMLPSKFGEMKKKKYQLEGQLQSLITLRKLDDASAVKTRIAGLESKLSDMKIVKQKHLLTKESVDLALSNMLSVPLGKLHTDELGTYKNLGSRLTKRVVGQEKAISAVSAALVRSRLGLKAKKGPIGSFLFLGPTGVGKTELARVLSEEIFGSDGLIKLDMSDFAEKHTVSRLVGAPPGYIGYNEGGELTEKIARKPFSVVLFDEIEKAHPDVLNILLQILEDGVLVDARGHAFDFSNAVVILTSNLGSELVYKNDLGFAMKPLEDEAPLEKGKTSAKEDKLVHNLKEILRPELLNRFDDIIVFNNLSKADMALVLDNILSEVQVGLAAKELSLIVSPAAKQELLKRGYSLEYGARALRRTVDKLIVDELANHLLTNKKAKVRVINVDFKNKFEFKLH